MRNEATSLGKLRKRMFGISLAEATFARRGFHSRDTAARLHLERIGGTFLQGYHAALEHDAPAALVPRLNAFDAPLRGFAFEGAAMALALLDLLTPWRRNRLSTFLAGPGEPHAYMVHVGAGWALAQLGWRVEPVLARLDPLLGWLVIDGYGFHAGYFKWRQYIVEHMLPKQLAGYARRVFDQGLGRSIWFVEGADVSRIPATIAAFAPPRQADLWSGVGLACAYAGGVDRPALAALWDAAGQYQPDMAQGVAFAAKARARAGNPAAHTELACQTLCDLTADDAAMVTDTALKRLPFDGDVPAYELWRQRIRAQLTREVMRLCPE